MSFSLFNYEHIALARQQASQKGTDLLDELAAVMNTSVTQLMHEISQNLALGYADLTQLNQLIVNTERVSLQQASQYLCMLACDQAGGVVALVSDPFDAAQIAFLESKIDAPARFMFARQSDLRYMLDQAINQAKASDAIYVESRQPDHTQAVINVIDFNAINDTSNPIIKFVNAILYDALKLAASDIHIQTVRQGVQVKFRIDGVLEHFSELRDSAQGEQVISRLKVLAELDIAEQRVPQDGSFRVVVIDREIDLRLSVMPSIHGEDAVLRILDKKSMLSDAGSLQLDALGFDEQAHTVLMDLIAYPYGMLLVTGPTGSGKTTTLYAALSEINSGKEKIITIEDPVEYQIPGILQIPVNEKKGLTFARGLRSILRHDPDKIMVGEIRDGETAEIAIQSALTGHLVLSTVHANNVFDVFGRFTHMGVDPYAFASALNGVWAQRLLRLNCQHCAESQLLDSGLKSFQGFKQSGITQVRRGKGCPYCRGTGYKGRAAIAEVLCLTDEMRECIVEKRPVRYLKELAQAEGTVTLRARAEQLLRQGLTTPEEVLRVTGYV